MRREDLYDTYERELLYLRRAGEGFSRAFPKVARRLALGPDVAGDPHVERLIECFAFVAARLQLDLDRRFPLLTEALLGVLYPHLLAPIPSCGIARVRLAPDGGQLTGRYDLPRGTPLVAMAGEDVRCRFTTTAPLAIWPLTIERTVAQRTDGTPFHDSAAGAVLRVDLAGLGVPLESLPIGSLRLFIHAEPSVAAVVYEALTSTVMGVAFTSEGGPVRQVRGQAQVTPASFDDEDSLLPYPGNGHPAYRLLQEYFAFPLKFMYVDIAIPEQAFVGKTGSIQIALSRPLPSGIQLRPDTLLTGCVPVVNLFNKICEPVRLDQRHTSYLVVPDALRDRITEIYSVTGVSGIRRNGDRTAYTQLFSVEHAFAGEEPDAFWHSTRTPSLREDVGGTDTWISLYNGKFEPTEPSSEALMVSALCSNRGLAEELPANALLAMEDVGPVATISLLYKPSLPVYRSAAGPTAWKLVSQMSLNHLSLSSDEASLTALREILALHALDDPTLQVQIAALKGLQVRPIVHRVGKDAWRGFCRGMEITLTVDERGFVGASPLVFGEVLSRFFAMYASVNSFTQLQFRSLHRGGGIWKTWPRLAGVQFAL